MNFSLQEGRASRFCRLALISGLCACTPDAPVPSGPVLLQEAEYEFDRSTPKAEGVLFDVDAGLVLIEQTLSKADWRRAKDGGFVADLKSPLTKLPKKRSDLVTLELGGRSFEMVRLMRDADPARSNERDVAFTRGGVLWTYPTNRSRPGPGVYREARVLRDSLGQVAAGPLSASGFFLPPGVALLLEVPSGGAGHVRLDLATPGPRSGEGWELPAGAIPSGTGEDSRSESQTWSIPCAAGTDFVRLRYDGPEAYGLVLEPRWIPKNAQASEQPSVLLFLADTFRADNLSAYRGLPGGPDRSLTPFLDKLFESEAAWFQNAWSTASWTLPAHGSLFTGLAPEEHTATERAFRLPEGIPVLAERFGELNYRTGAITDGAYVTPKFGMARGFDRFAFGEANLGRTTTEVLAWLDEPDPRARFLFVQTYRVHSPYSAQLPAWEFVTSPPRPELAEYSEIRSRLTPSESRRDAVLASPPEVVAQLNSLYLAGVHEFDDEFRELWTRLAARGFGKEHLIAFTSDHGESFGERGRLGHGQHLGESETRIPLAFFQAGLERGPRESAASLLDVGTTLLEQISPGAAALGRGRNLLATQLDEVPVVAHQVATADFGSHRALWTSRKKWLIEENEPLLEFDLPIDPARHAGRDVPMTPFTDFLAEISTPRISPEPIGALDVDAIEQLEALGYLAD